MLAIAREFGYSETTFVVPPTREEATSRLRSFTPTAEVFGAGHNALGAWWVLAAERRIRPAGSLTIVQQELGARVRPVEIHFHEGAPSAVFMNHEPPTWGRIVEDLRPLARALGLAEEDLGAFDLPVQAVSTGATHVLVPVRNLSVLGRARPDAGRLVAVARPLGGQGCYLFSLEPGSPNVARARAFFPGIAIAEDPATGSAAGPLAAHLVAHGRAAPGDFIVNQGIEMGRPSRIEVRVDGAEVKVGGTCVIVGEGELRVAPLS